MPVKIIVIDDDDDTLDVFSTYLEMKHFEVLAKGKNGLEAVELYKKHKPDVVLLDIMMPHYDGFYALEKIKEIDSKAKVIVVTGDLTEQTARRLEDLGAIDLLYKPYEIDDVTNVVNCVVEGKKINVASLSRRF